MGIGMALPGGDGVRSHGRLVTTSLAEYVVAVNADVRDVDVLFVGQPDSMTPLGTKGVGELAITGMAAAIANAVYHATGMRVRSLPISIEKVLAHESSIARDRSPVAAIAGTPRSASPEAV
jgi:CO/xanthine dehydrogenase Mo-binding subunit